MPSGLSNIFNLARQRTTDKYGADLGGKIAAGGNFGSIFLKDSIAKGKEFEARADSLADRNDAQIANIDGRLNRVRAGANSAVQAATSAPAGGPRGFARALDINTRRGKARQGIEQRGENAIRNQQLKDRITQARSGLNRRSLLQNTSANVARMRAGDLQNVRRVNNQTNSAFAGAAGAIAGGAVRGFGDNFFNNDFDTGLMQQQDQVDSFFGAQPGGGGISSNSGFDFGQTGGAVYS